MGYYDLIKMTQKDKDKKKKEIGEDVINSHTQLGLIFAIYEKLDDILEVLKK